MRPTGLRIYWIFGVTLSALGASACATASPGSRPADMSAAAHRAEADRHERQSLSHAQDYDSAAVTTRRHPGGSAAYDLDYDLGLEVYNPTVQHGIAAESHHDEAQQHLNAAEALESFEEAECREFPPETRALCPLIGQVISVEDTPKGVRLRFAPGVNVEAATDHMRCHIAYGQTMGERGMDQCPLYISGVQLSGDGSGVVELSVEDDTLVAELRRRAANHVGR